MLYCFNSDYVYDLFHHRQHTIKEYYYDKNGKKIITHIKATDRAFSSEEEWEPSDVRPKLIAKGSWYNDNYKRPPMLK